MNIRLLEETDFDKGFLDVLQCLTLVGDISRDEFKQRWEDIFFDTNYYIYVAEKEGKVVGAATLLVERKFIHHCGSVGHIEDVVVDRRCEGCGVGSALMKKLIEIAKRRKCYKVILDCADDLVPFYERFGFRKKENQVRLDIISP